MHRRISTTLTPAPAEGDLRFYFFRGLAMWIRTAQLSGVLDRKFASGPRVT